jgi:hypothetical protein
MSQKKVDITIAELAATFVAIGGDAKTISKLVKHTQPKLKTGRRKMVKVDPNLNRNFKIKRINYSIIATIGTGSDDLYNATITSVFEGNSPYGIGESFPISKRELELTGVPTSSK